MRDGLPVPSRMGSSHSRRRGIRVFLSGGASGCGGGQLPAARGKDRLGTSQQVILRGDITDGAMKTHYVVVGHIGRHQPPRLAQGDGALGEDALTFERLVPTFQLPVALRIEGRGAHVGHAHQTDEGLEFLGDKLRTVVENDPWPGDGNLFARPLQNDFDVRLLYLLPDPASVKAVVAFFRRR